MMPRLSLAFFASGFAALLCQIVWQRMLGIFAGSDTISAALVVGAFLAGLGIGSLAGARLADRLSAVGALLGFAAAEIGVGLFALVSKPFLYDWIASGLAGKVDAPAAIFALCFAGLVLPILQGWLMILIALSLIDLPIKHRAHVWLLRWRWYQKIAAKHETAMAMLRAFRDKRRAKRG